MFDKARITPVPEAAGKPADQPKPAIHLAQQQPARVRRDIPTIETRHDGTPFDCFKFEQFRATVRLHRGLSVGLTSYSHKTTFSDSTPRCTIRV